MAESKALPPLEQALKEVVAEIYKYLPEEVAARVTRKLDEKVLAKYREETQAYESTIERAHMEVMRLRQERKRDANTGLLSMAEFIRQGAKLLSDPRRRYREVLYGDVAGFSHTNEVVGHRENDRIMFILAHVLSEKLRPEDLLCRYAQKGDEFAAILPIDTMTHKTADTTSQKLQAVASSIDWESVEIHLSQEALDYIREVKLFADQELRAGERVHLRLKPETYLYLTDHPIGLDVGCLIVDLGENAADRPDRSNARTKLMELVDLADKQVMTVKTGKKKPRKGKIVCGTCKFRGGEIVDYRQDSLTVHKP